MSIPGGRRACERATVTQKRPHLTTTGAKCAAARTMCACCCVGAGAVVTSACGCRGRGYLGLPPAAVAATDADAERGDAEGDGGESDVEVIIAALGGVAGSGGITPIDISGEGNPGVLGW